MFNIGDTAYFVFRGNWSNGSYKGHFCLYCHYFPFMPVKIIEIHTNPGYRLMCCTKLHDGRSWTINADLLEKEFSLGRFIVAMLEWNKRMTVEQFKTITSTLPTME